MCLLAPLHTELLMSLLIPQYKPFSLNMFWLLTVCIMYAFTDKFYDKSSKKLHQRDSLGTPVSCGLDTIQILYTWSRYMGSLPQPHHQ